MNTIEFSTPYSKDISQSNYLQSIKDLIQKERVSDQTIVLHTDEEILSKYASSIVATLEDQIIGNSSIYPTKMKPLSDLILDSKTIRVGESGSVIIHPDFRWLWLGKKITYASLKTFSSDYDLIVGATVNKIMFELRLQQGFEQIPFPKDLYEEGKAYLAPFMQGGIQEFEARAKCMMRSFWLTEKQKQELIVILQQEYVDSSI